MKTAAHDQSLVSMSAAQNLVQGLICHEIKSETLFRQNGGKFRMNRIDEEDMLHKMQNKDKILNFAHLKVATRVDLSYPKNS